MSIRAKYIGTPGNVKAGCVILKKEYDLFNTAHLEIFLDEDMPAIKCGGTIVWIIRRKPGEKKAGSEYDVGIEFTDISDEDRGELISLVENIIEDQT